jgi:hypothetical protein
VLKSPAGFVQDAVRLANWRSRRSFAQRHQLRIYRHAALYLHVQDGLEKFRLSRRREREANLTDRQPRSGGRRIPPRPACGKLSCPPGSSLIAPDLIRCFDGVARNAFSSSGCRCTFTIDRSPLRVPEGTRLNTNSCAPGISSGVRFSEREPTKIRSLFLASSPGPGPPTRSRELPVRTGFWSHSMAQSARKRSILLLRRPPPLAGGTKTDAATGQGRHADQE